MPLRGESVGTAYIRLLADGSGLPESIRDEVEKADSAFDDAGSRDAKAYKKALAEELEKHDDHALRDAFNKALAADDAIDDFFTSERWHRTETNFRARFGGLGEDAARQIEAKFRQSGSLEGIETEIEQVVSRINRNVDESIRTQSRAAEKAKQEMLDFERNFRRVMDESSEVSRRVSRDNVANLESLRRVFERFHPTLGTFGRDLRKAEEELGTSGRTVDRNRHLFSRFGLTIDRIADGVGRAFGKGSRSELLNFIGSFIGGFVSLIGLPAKLLGNLGEFTEGFKLAREAGEGFFASIRSGFTTMGKDASGASTALSGLFESGLASIPLLAIALVAIVAVLSTVAALISGIVAALLALAATISFGVVGALAPLVGLLAPIALGIGTIVLAIKTLDDKSKRALTQAIKPLTNGLKELGAAAREGFLNTFDRSLPALATKLQELEPLVRAIGRAFGSIGNEIIDSFDSPTLTRFLDTMTTFAPRAIRSLAAVVGNLGRAFAAIFTDSVPVTRQFLNFLVDITDNFADFVNQNPDKVLNFLDDAAQSARILGRFLGAVVDLFGTIISAGRKTGNNIFKDLTRSIKRFTDFLKPKQQGQDVFDEANSHLGNFRDNIDKLPKTSPLDGFFDNGQQVATDLGNIAVSLGQIFDALDSPAGRKNLHIVLDALTKISALAGPLATISNLTFNFGGFVALGAAADGIDKAARAIARIGNIRLPNFDFASKIKSAFSGLGNLFSGQGGGRVLAIRPPNLNWIPGVLDKLRGIGTTMDGVGDRINSLWRTVMTGVETRVRTAATTVADLLRGIPGRLGGLTSRFGNAASNWAAEILNRIKNVPTQIVNFFQGLGQRIIDAIGSIHIPVTLDLPDNLPGGKFNPLNHLATGGLFDRAQVAVIGEAGPEAVVPLSGPLSQVDPAVRWLAAIARGMTPDTQHVGSGTPGKTINNEWHITTPTTDTKAVANELLNAMVATAY